MARTKWPKKMSVSKYRKLHYADNDRCQTTLINDIKRGALPGIKEGGRWYVWVLPNNDAAYGYEPLNTAAADIDLKIERTGNQIADGILNRVASENGFNIV